jgi:carbonic anhydrase/acetyltransferase-like protein (isoleucine patch superfamily)
MNMRPNPRGDWPEVHPAAYVDLTAQVIGRVQIGPRVFVGPNTVIRADELDKYGQVKPIVIEAESNVQDGVIIHALAGTELKIGQRTSLAHGAIVHGPCRIGEGCFIGFGAVIFNANVGSGVFIAARAVVQDVDVAAKAFVPTDARLAKEQVRRLGETDARQRRFMEQVVETNIELAQMYLDGADNRVGGGADAS